jgi:hypothetical protein
LTWDDPAREQARCIVFRESELRSGFEFTAVLSLKFVQRHYAAPTEARYRRISGTRKEFC